MLIKCRYNQRFIDEPYLSQDNEYYFKGMIRLDSSNSVDPSQTQIIKNVKKK
jgi:hypothetical protein